MILFQKRSGNIKGCFAYKGKASREWICKEEKASPTVLTESIMHTTTIDAHEERHVTSFDIPKSFIQILLPVKSD